MEGGITPSADALNQEGIRLYRLGAIPAASLHFRAAIAANPEGSGAWSNFAICLAEERKFPAAVAAVFKALEHSKDEPSVLGTVGSILWQAEHYDEALPWLRIAVQKNPNDAGFHHNFALGLLTAGFAAKAEEEFDIALSIDPNMEAARSDRAYAILRQGDLIRGLEAHESRWSQMERSPWQDSFIPRWDGREPLRGRTIVVWQDQGYGDTLMWFRAVRALAQEPVVKVLLSVPDPLRKLLANADPLIKVIGPYPEGVVADYQVPINSLPYLRKWTIDRLASTAGAYITSDEKSPFIRRGGRLKIGLTWRSGEYGTITGERKSFSFETLAPLVRHVTGVDFYSLQIGGASEDLARLGFDPLVIDLSPQIKTFADSAAILNNLDLLITVDTGIAHLAGAMGIPTVVLLPFDCCWRWTIGKVSGSGEPWYTTVKTIRQTSPGDWAGVVKRVESYVNSIR